MGENIHSYRIVHDKTYYLYAYIKTWGVSAREMISFTHNEWGQHDIMNNNIILIKRGADTIYTVLPTKYCKYTSTTILKHANVLAKVNKPYF